MKNTSTEKKSFINYFASTIIIVIFILSSSGKVYAQKKEKLMGEKNFDIELTEQGKKKTPEPVKDQLLFRANKLSSNYMMKQFVFTASAYTATVDSTSGSPIITFVSDSKNADGDLLKWNGTVKGESMEGNAVITDKKGKVQVEYSFKGEQKKFRAKY